MRIGTIGLTVLLLLCLLAGTAAADPVLARGDEVAWLGEQNFLFLEDGARGLKQLPAAIARILSADGENFYCLTESGRLYAVRTDGSGSALVSAEPTPEMLAEYAAKDVRLTLDETSAVALSFPDGTKQPLMVGAVAVCRNAGKGFIVLEETGGSCLLLSCSLPESADGLTPMLSAETAVARPIAIFAGRDAVTLVKADHSVQVYDLEERTLTDFPAISDQTAAAVWARGKLFRYTGSDETGWRLEKAEAAELRKANLATPTAVLPLTPTPPVQVTPPPVPVYTATPSPKPAPTVTEDKTIRKWDRGSRVRKMQQRLRDLGYPVGKVDGVYGEDTATAVCLFQNSIGFKEHSYLTEKGQRRLYSANAPYYDPYVDLKKDDRGVRVRLMQQALLALGISPGKIDGVYGKNTIAAVAVYQQLVGMQLAPGEVPGEKASRWLLMNLYGALPPVTHPPVDPTDPPVDPTDPPVDPTDPPVDPTDPPVDPTDPPVDPTDTPVDPTDPPVDPTDPPVDPTDPPADPTDPPVDPTDPPVDPTDPPVDPTDPPVDPTDPPASPTDL